MFRNARELESVEAWWADGKNNQRKCVDYPLNADSVIIDVGGYHGDWSAKMVALYNPHITIFEPIPEFYESLVSRFKDNPKVVVLNVGLSDSDTVCNISKCGDASSVYWEGGAAEPIKLRDVCEFDRGNVDLISINCEGGEYRLLSRILETGMVKRCKYIQVQFHSFYPDSENLRDAIRDGLRCTHTELYNCPFVWESWVRK